MQFNICPPDGVIEPISSKFDHQVMLLANPQSACDICSPRDCFAAKNSLLYLDLITRVHPDDDIVSYSEGVKCLWNSN